MFCRTATIWANDHNQGESFSRLDVDAQELRVCQPKFLQKRFPARVVVQRFQKRLCLQAKIRLTFDGDSVEPRE